MKKTTILLVLGVALFLASAAAPKAHAGVAVGIAVGTPVYVHPLRPYFVPRPYVAWAPAPVYPRVYVGQAPVYYRHWYPRGYVVVRHDYCRRWR
jgi:hypothetical protein